MIVKMTGAEGELADGLMMNEDEEKKRENSKLNLYKIYGRTYI
jgi:hypothetical protein